MPSFYPYSGKHGNDSSEAWSTEKKLITPEMHQLHQYPALSQYSKFSLNIYLANWAGHTHVTNNWLMPVGG